jgi:hypothetical protein
MAKILTGDMQWLRLPSAISKATKEGPSPCSKISVSDEPFQFFILPKPHLRRCRPLEAQKALIVSVRRHFKTVDKVNLS